MINRTMFKSLLTLKNITIYLTFLIVLINCYFLFVHMMVIKNRPFEPGEPGYQFLDFREPVKGVKNIGYLTNKDMSPENNDGFFLQAQYFLAPSVIKLSDPTHEFTIIDSVNPVYAVSAIKAINSKRVANNMYGQGLFKKK